MVVDPRALSVLDRLGDEVEELAGRIVERLASEDVEGARSGRIRPADLRPTVEGTIRSAVEALRAGRLPTDAELTAAAAVGAERARQGFTLVGMLLGVRAGAREALARAQALAEETGLDAATSMALAAGLWDWVDAVSAEMVGAHRRVELARTRQDQQQRASFLHALVFGSISAQELAEGAAAYGLDLEADHRALRTRPTREHPADALERIVKPTRHVPGLVGSVEGNLVAILAARPVGELPVPAGIGPAVPLSGIAASFRLAGRALETAIAFERPGCHALEDLSLRPAVLAEDELGQVLLRRYIDPVRRLGAFGEQLLHSLLVYVENDQSVEASARVLHVHPNTLRHRLARFQQETGASLRDVESVAELWWALARHDLDQRRV